MSPEEGSPVPDFTTGVARMRSTLGDEAADSVLRAHERATARGDAARVEVPVSTTWGWLFDRPGLAASERAIAMLSVDIARGTMTALREHVRLALRVGVTPDAVRELLVHLGPYTGYPAINEATRVVTDELALTADGTHALALPLGPVRRARPSLVVEDAHAAARMLGELIGIPRWDVSDLSTGTVSTDLGEVTVTGTAAVGTSPTGLEIELLAPTGGDSPLYRELLVAGPTTHHLGLVEAPVDELEAWLPQLSRQGFSITTTRWDGATLAVVDTTSVLGYRLGIAAPDFAAVAGARSPHDEWHTPVPDGGRLLPPGPDEHLGVIAPDLHDVTVAHARLLGRNTWHVLSFDSRRGTLAETRLHDQPVVDGYLSTVAGVGDTVLELVQPTVTRSRYREAEADGKSHVHHLYTGHQRGLAAWAPLVERLEQHGYHLAAEGSGWDGGLRYGYLDTRDALGIDLEIAALEPGALHGASDAIAFSLRHHDHHA